MVLGESTLKVIAAHRDQLELVGIAANGNHTKLAEIARTFGVKHVGLHDAKAMRTARTSGSFAAGTVFHEGTAGLSELAQLPDADTVLVAVVGTTALQPTLEDESRRV